MSETYKQLKNELLDQSTYTLKEVEHRLDMVMFHAADMAEDEADGFTRYYYAEYQCLMELSDKLRKEVHGE